MRELKLKSVKYFILLLLFSTINSGCGKIEESVIPSVPFSLTINLTNFNEVNQTGNSTYISGYGYGGVIVYCESPGIFYAYDATCTNEVLASCHLGKDGVIGSIVEACPCCGSEYILLGGGYPSSGPAVQGLRPFKTSVYSGTLRIYNQ